MTILGMITLITMQIFNCSTTAAQKQERIILTGTVIAYSGEGSPKALLIADDGASMPIGIGSNGRFWVNVPAGLNYQIAFARRGCVTMVVLLDLTSAGQEHRGRLSFDVALFAGHELTSIIAGKIGYAPGNGRLLLEHHPAPSLENEVRFIQVDRDVLP